MKLTLRQNWLEPDFWPADLYEAPFEEMTARPCFDTVVEASIESSETTDTLARFAARLVRAVETQLRPLDGPIHCLLSGGYDSRILATLLERMDKHPLYITDGDEEPECGDTLDFLKVPKKRRYTHDLSRPDPYGLVDAECDGWAPLYQRMRFMPGNVDATLVTGLGGGEWFSYPAAGWHDPRPHRVPHTELRNMWVDTWPPYWLLPDAWAHGYRGMLNPYCTPEYAAVANTCRREWLVEVNPRMALDKVREAMLDHLDPDLPTLGWKPHRYDWRLTRDDREEIDRRWRASWLAMRVPDPGRPSDMHENVHACTLAGFAGWCDRLIAQGAQIA